MIRVIGLDPGFASMGWAVMEFDGARERFLAMGVLRTEKAEKKRRVLASDDNVRRSRFLSRELVRLIMEHDVRAICAESMSFPRSSSVAAKMAMAWGVLCSIAESRAMPMVQASPKEIKRATVGDAAASKEKVEAWMTARHPETAAHTAKLNKGMHEHAFDAAAAVVACADSDVVRALRSAS